MNFTKTAEQYRMELFDNVIAFWQKHSQDTEYGGYFSCLDRTGAVYDTDKFIWLQCRQVWLFSMLYNRYRKEPKWLAMAKHGIEFLVHHGMDEHGNWYFALDQTGRPLVQPYNIFSDFFAAMALSQYGLTVQDTRYTDLALKTYQNILRRKSNPKGPFNKQISQNRPLYSMGFSMIMANLALEMEHLLSYEELNRILDVCVWEVTERHLDKKKKLLYEHVLADGSHLDCFDGRLLNPGHGIEAMWFILDIGLRRQDSTLIELTADVILNTLEYAWDTVYEGIFYFMDAENKPLQQLEWDQKLWWVHLETLVALAKAYRVTRRPECLKWFERVHRYSWSHFRDPEYGEWYGYLNRRGEVLLPLKGGKWKGCFHVPRALWLCYNEFDKLAATV